MMKVTGGYQRVPDRAELVERFFGIDADGNVLAVAAYRFSARPGFMYFVVRYREADRRTERGSRRVRCLAAPVSREGLERYLAPLREELGASTDRYVARRAAAGGTAPSGVLAEGAVQDGRQVINPAPGFRSPRPGLETMPARAPARPAPGMKKPPAPGNYRARGVRGGSGTTSAAEVPSVAFQEAPRPAVGGLR